MVTKTEMAYEPLERCFRIERKQMMTVVACQDLYQKENSSGSTECKQDHQRKSWQHQPDRV